MTESQRLDRALKWAVVFIFLMWPIVWESGIGGDLFKSFRDW
jgi:hypothetical protein